MEGSTFFYYYFNYFNSSYSGVLCYGIYNYLQFWQYLSVVAIKDVTENKKHIVHFFVEFIKV